MKQNQSGDRGLKLEGGQVATFHPLPNQPRSSILTCLFLAALVSIPLSGTAQGVATVVATNLAEPFGAVADGAGSIYISDAANNRIEKFNVTTSVKQTLAGSATQPAGSDNGTGSQARFYYPQGLVLARGGLVVADSGNNTIRFVGFNGVVTNIAGQAGAYNFADGVGAAANFANPLGLAAAANGDIFIADMGNNRIRKLAPNNLVTTVVSTGLSQPAGVAVGENGEIWVADTHHHVIKQFNASGALLSVAGLPGTSGTADSEFAGSARFTSPQGLLWLGGNTGLLIADSGNHIVRRLFTNQNSGGYSVETLAGTPGQAGFANGTPLGARFSSPIGLARDPVNGGFIIVDRANNAVRRLQTTAPLPPISKPAIGTVSFPAPQELSLLTPVESAVFNNDVIIAVLAEAGTETFYTFGATPASSFEDTIPVPSSLTGNSAPPYANGLPKAAVNGTLIAPQPDVTVKVISTQDGRQSSPPASARFQFKTANPSTEGDNAASFVVNDITAGAEIYYTLDGSDPTNNGTANPAAAGPVAGGTRLSLVISSNTVFKARAYRANYKPSEIASKEFSPVNFVANRISLGFASGEASSDFIASAGQRFYAPVTLSILPAQVMYSLQFNVSVTNLAASASVTPGGVGFKSMLKEYDPDTKLYRTIPPALLASYAVVQITNVVNGVTNLSSTNVPVFQNLLVTNTVGNLLGVGWLARSGLDKEVPNLFRVDLQDLISFSIAKDTLFLKANGKVVAGGYFFDVPASALDGETYSVQINRPSATTDGFGAPGSDVYIETPSHGSLTNGAINAKKTVKVGHRKYIVGDVYPFRWLNAGDFGDTNLVSADVAQVFQTSTYGLNAPIAGSDLEDAMDSCCETGFVNGDGNLQQTGLPGDNGDLFDGNDLTINSFVFGDGQLDVRDVFVTFRRSLDPSLNWYERFYTNGMRVANVRSNLFNGARPASGKTPAAARPTGPAPLVNFTIGDISGAPGQTVSVPITAKVFGSYPLRVMQFNVTVESVDGSPAITNAIQFTPAGLGQPTMVMSSGPNNYAAAWLNHAIAGLSGTGGIGTLQIQIPGNATAASAWRIHFNHVSASPNGLARFSQHVQDGLVLLASRTNSSWGDGIPDTWRLRYFGSLGNALSQAAADADGDGASNWAEYKMGTDPNDVSSFLHLMKPKKDAGLTVRWPSVGNKHYVIECSPALFATPWSVISTNLIGDGQEMEFTDPTQINGTRFYRVRVLDE